MSSIDRRTAVNDIIDGYLRAQHRPGDMERDAAYQLQLHVIRSMLAVLEDSLTAEGVTGETAGRVVRRLLYGSPLPDPDEALERMTAREEAVKAAMLAPPVPVDVTALLGFPPL